MKLTIRMAKMKVSVCTIGRSLAWIAPISAAPIPDTPNRFSVMIAPPKIAGIPRAITVTTGISELRSTCFSTTTCSDIPFARAVRT